MVCHNECKMMTYKIIINDCYINIINQFLLIYDLRILRIILTSDAIYALTRTACPLIFGIISNLRQFFNLIKPDKLVKIHLKPL